MGPNNYISLTEAADLIGVHRSTLYRWVEKSIEGELDVPFAAMAAEADGTPAAPYFFDGDDLVDWFAEHRAHSHGRRGRNPGR